MAETSLGTATIKIKATLDELDKGLSEAKGKAGAATDSISSKFGAIKWPVVGAAATAGIGFLSGMAREAQNFETGMREVNTMMGLSEAEFKSLSAEVRSLSGALGVDAVGSTKALYQAISAGVPKENVLEFLEIASKAAIGGVTDTETAIDGVTTVLNAFHMDASQAQEVADIMFTTVKGGKTTFDELSNSLFNVAPLAAQAGVGFDEVSAAIATLTKQGTPTSVATTQLRAAIQAIIKPTEDMAKAMRPVVDEMITTGQITGQQAEQYQRLSGLLDDVGNRHFETAQKMEALTAAGKDNSAEFKKLKADFAQSGKALDDLGKALGESAAGFGPMILKAHGLGGTFELLNASANGNMNTLGKMYGSVEGLSAVLSTTGSNADMFAADLASMQNATGASTAAFDEMEKSSGRWGAHVKARMQEVSIAVGDFLGPAQGVIALLPGFSAGFAAVGAVVGYVVPLLGGLATTLMGTVIPAIGATLAALGPILLPILAIGAAIAVLALAWSNNWFDIQGKAAAAAEFLGKLFQGLSDVVGGIWEGIQLTIRNSVNAIIGIVNSFIRAVNAIEIHVPEINIPFVGIVGGFTIGFPDIPEIPMLATGGIVTRPTLAMLGEDGPEAIVPLGAGGVGGSGGGINVTLQGDVILDGRKVGEVILRDLQGQRQSGRVLGLV